MKNKLTPSAKSVRSKKTLETRCSIRSVDFSTMGIVKVERKSDPYFKSFRERNRVVVIPQYQNEY